MTNKYKAFGIEISEGEEFTLEELYNNLGENFHDNTSFIDFVHWVLEGGFSLINEDGCEWFFETRFTPDPAVEIVQITKH